MTAQQMAIYQMMHGVQEHGDTYPDLWSGSVPFANAFALFKGRLEVLDAYLPKQVSPSTLRSQKKAVLDDLRGAMNALVTGLRSFGYDHDRQDVVDMAQYTPTDIKRLSLTDLASIAAALHGRVKDMLDEQPQPKLEDYGITAGTQSALAGYIAQFSLLHAQEREARVIPIDATANIAALLAEIGGILNNRLDNAAELLRAAQPDFVAQYFIARRVDDARHQALALMLHVQDAGGKPIERALAALPNGITRKTTAKGNCQVQNLPEGTFTITVSKAGYTTATQQVNITGGETEVATVVLRRVE